MRISPFLVPAAAAAIAGGAVGCHKAKPPPSIDGLSAALERSAEKSLAAPSLADEQILLPALPGQTDAQAAGIARAFAAAGGIALSSTDSQGQISIMADIPAVNVAALKATLRHEQAAMQKEPATPTRLIEVLIQNPTPTPSPTP